MGGGGGGQGKGKGRRNKNAKCISGLKIRRGGEQGENVCANQRERKKEGICCLLRNGRDPKGTTKFANNKMVFWGFEK